MGTTGSNLPMHTPQSYVALLGASGARLTASHAAAPLSTLVAALLAELTAVRASFTAYDVTLILRALFPLPLRELPHYDRHGLPGVQPEVHRQMEGYLRSGVYAERVAFPNGVDPARLYVPAPARRRGVRALRALIGAPATAGLPSGAWVVSGGKATGGKRRSH